MRFTEKRNAMIFEVLKPKQKNQFNRFEKIINPITLEINLDEKAKLKKLKN